MYNRKRRFRRKPRRSFRRKFRRSSLALRAYKIAKRVDKRAERKYFNSTYTSALSTTFNVSCPIEIAQGDTAVTRDGNQIDCLYTRVRMNFTSNAGSNITGCLVRVVVVQALQQVADTAIANGDVFANAASWNSVYNFPTASGYFRVLKDMTLNVTPRTLGYASAGGTASSVNTETFRSFKIKPPRKRILYNGSLSTDFQKNQYYLLFAKSNNGYTVTPDIQYQTCFIDS